MIGGGNPLWLIVLAAAVAILPILIGILTSYVKINIILSFLRSGLGAQQVPGNLVIMALSLALTAYIMSPVISKTFEIGENIQVEDFKGSPNFENLKKLTPLFAPWSEFMLKHSGEREIAVLTQLAEEEKTKEEPPIRIVIPAFVLTEIKAAFMMGFMVLLPFLVIDLVVANVLTGMGMYMLSPVIVSLPLKLILFVMADGWLLLTKGIIQSY